MRKAISILLITMVLLSSVAPVFAAGTASYEGNKVFEFKPGSEKSETDLFGGEFDNVMPDDVLKETVTVKNSSKKTVKMYMQPLGKLDETVSGFLSQMTLTVTNTADGKTIFDDTADKGLDSEVLLGKLAKGGSVTLLRSMYDVLLIIYHTRSLLMPLAIS